MKHMIISTFAATMAATLTFAATFEKIDLNTPILSEEDPLGVSAIQQAQSNISTIQETVSEVKAFVTNTISTTTVDGKKKSQLTGDVVVIGNVKDGNTVSMMKADTNSILFAVNRDMEDISIEDGTIKFDADNIKFPGVNGIWFGDSTLSTILSEAGQGEVNTIVTVKTNGVALVPDANRAIDITIPAPTESSLDGKLDATNGVAFGDFKVYPMPSGIVGQTHTIITHESMSIGDVEYKEDGITYNGETYEFSSDTNGVARLKDIPTISTNGVAIAPDASKNIDIAIPTVPDLDSYKNPALSAAALEAISGINNAEDISTIKTSLTNFLHQFVIQSP